MSVFKGSMGYMRFIAVAGAEAKTLFTRAINARRFKPLESGNEEMNDSAGWAPVMNPYDDTHEIQREDYEFGDRIILVYRHDQWQIPRPRLRFLTNQKIKEICDRENKPVSETGRGFKKAIERSVLIDLRSRSIPRTKLIECVWDQKRGEMRAFGTGTAVTERLASLFERTFGVRCDLAVPAMRALRSADGDERAINALTRVQPSLLTLASRSQS